MALLGNLTGSSQFFNPNRFYNDIATQSLRFDSGSSAVLSKTPSASNLKTWTWCAWVKRTKLGVERAIWSVGASEVDFALFFHTTDQLRVWTTNGVAVYYTDRLFRDVGSWYHIAITSNNVSPYIRLYINGVLNTTSSYDNRTSVPGTNDLSVNTNDVHRIGSWYNGGLQYFDGYLADVNHIDGTAVGDTNGILDEFIEIKNGVCIPKRYTGSYGTNGYRLEFKQTGTGSASSSTIGADTSGNDNHYTSSGIVASDCAMPDSPENNFPTINVLHRGSSYSSTTTSEGNLSFKHSNFAHASAIASMTLPKSGKWYWETLNNSNATSGTNTIGVVGSTYNNSEALSGAGSFFWANGFGIYGGAGQNFGASLGVTWDTTGSATSFTANDIIGVAYDADNKNIEWYKNGTLMDYNVTDFNDTDNDIMPASSAYGNPANAGIIFNFGQDPSFAGSITAGTETPSEGVGVFKHAVPSGYLALCTANLPEPTISPNADEQADDYFNTIIWTGDNTSSRSITGVGFQPDFSWVKSRSNANNHNITDAVRGVNKQLLTNTASAESTYTTYITAFGSDGFTVGNDGDVNGSGKTYVAWNWKAGGTAVSNTDGTITSSVSANTDAGFSIVSYTGTDSATETIGHGLGAVPAMLIIKSRDSSLNWAVYHKGSDATAPEDYLLRLNTIDARADVTSAWNDTAPTSSVFTVGTSSLVNNTDDFIAYCFAEIEGYSKFGSYIGNGSTDGTFVYTGFRPAFVLVKDTGAADWDIQDTTRSPFNPSVVRLWANLSSAEVTSTYDIDFLSNGFKLRSTNPDTNSNGDTKIYMAFAENPFKYANAR